MDQSPIKTTPLTSLERVRIGQKAPDFCCQALVGGTMQVSLGTYINPPGSQDAASAATPWLTMLFIPAAFSHSCPVEVLAFQDSFAQFRSRNCNVTFISVDTKKSLWYWQSIPRKHGGLGHVDIPLLSDPDNQIAKDYGVVIEELGIDIRGMFLIDGEGIVQQATLDHCQIDRSVTETLRVLDAYQSFSRVGVPYPINWKADVGVDDDQSDCMRAPIAKTKSAESATRVRLGHATSWSLLRRDSAVAAQSGTGTGYIISDTRDMQASLAAVRRRGKGLTRFFV